MSPEMYLECLDTPDLFKILELYLFYGIGNRGGMVLAKKGIDCIGLW